MRRLGQRARERIERTRVCTERTVLTSLHHAMREAGIPVELWDRTDMQCYGPLIRAMRRVIWERWLCLPVIRDGDTVGEICSRVVWAYHGGFERRSG